MQTFYCIAKDRNEKTGWHFVTFEAESKRDFLQQVRYNGYSVMRGKAYTEEEFRNL